MRTLIIKETNKGRWQIENSQGIVIVDDLRLESVYRATEYIRKYVSSYQCYGYEVIPLTKENKINGLK